MDELSRRACLSVIAGGAALLANGPSWAGAERFSLADTAWEKAGRIVRLDPYLLYAVGYVESRLGRKGRVGPWPYAIRTPNQSHYPADYGAALGVLEGLSEEERLDSDMGWMQVNVRWHGKRVPDLTHLLHPAINLRIGAGILREAVDSAPGDPELAVGRYHTWMDEARGRDYGRRVLTLRRKLRELAGLTA